jgi:hypothetical protein
MRKQSMRGEIAPQKSAVNRGFLGGTSKVFFADLPDNLKFLVGFGRKFFLVKNG